MPDHRASRETGSDELLENSGVRTDASHPIVLLNLTVRHRQTSRQPQQVVPCSFWLPETADSDRHMALLAKKIRQCDWVRADIMDDWSFETL